MPTAHAPQATTRPGWRWFVGAAMVCLAAAGGSAYELVPAPRPALEPVGFYAITPPGDAPRITLGASPAADLYLQGAPAFAEAAEAWWQGSTVTLAPGPGGGTLEALADGMRTRSEPLEPGRYVLRHTGGSLNIEVVRRATVRFDATRDGGDARCRITVTGTAPTDVDLAEVARCLDRGRSEDALRGEGTLGLLPCGEQVAWSLDGRPDCDAAPRLGERDSLEFAGGAFSAILEETSDAERAVRVVTADGMSTEYTATGGPTSAIDGLPLSIAWTLQGPRLVLKAGAIDRLELRSVDGGDDAVLGRLTWYPPKPDRMPRGTDPRDVFRIGDAAFALRAGEPAADGSRIVAAYRVPLGLGRKWLLATSRHPAFFRPARALPVPRCDADTATTPPRLMVIDPESDDIRFVPSWLRPSSSLRARICLTDAQRYHILFSGPVDDSGHVLVQDAHGLRALGGAASGGGELELAPGDGFFFGGRIYRTARLNRAVLGRALLVGVGVVLVAWLGLFLAVARSGMARLPDGTVQGRLTRNAALVASIAIAGMVLVGLMFHGRLAESSRLLGHPGTLDTFVVTVSASLVVAGALWRALVGGDMAVGARVLVGLRWAAPWGGSVLLAVGATPLVTVGVQQHLWAPGEWPASALARFAPLVGVLLVVVGWALGRWPAPRAPAAARAVLGRGRRWVRGWRVWRMRYVGGLVSIGLRYAVILVGLILVDLVTGALPFGFDFKDAAPAAIAVSVGLHFGEILRSHVIETPSGDAPADHIDWVVVVAIVLLVTSWGGSVALVLDAGPPRFDVPEPWRAWALLGLAGVILLAATVGLWRVRGRSAVPRNAIMAVGCGVVAMVIASLWDSELGPLMIWVPVMVGITGLAMLLAPLLRAVRRQRSFVLACTGIGVGVILTPLLAFGGLMSASDSSTLASLSERARQRVELLDTVFYADEGEWLVLVRQLADRQLGGDVWIDNLNSDVAFFGLKHLGLASSVVFVVLFVTLLLALAAAFIANYGQATAAAIEREGARVDGTLSAGLVGAMLLLVAFAGVLFQAIIHLACGGIAHLPVTGVALPWLSHGGGTHLIHTMLVIGTLAIGHRAVVEPPVEGGAR